MFSGHPFFLLFSSRGLEFTALLQLKHSYNAPFLKNRKTRKKKVVFTWLVRRRRWSLLIWGLSFILNSRKQMRNINRGVCPSPHHSVSSPSLLPRASKENTIHMRTGSSLSLTFPRSLGKKGSLAARQGWRTMCALLSKAPLWVSGIGSHPGDLADSSGEARQVCPLKVVMPSLNMRKG